MASKDLWVGRLLKERQAEDPLMTWQPTAPQSTYLAWQEAEAWFIAANRCGKSDVLAAAIASTARHGVVDPRASYAGGMEIRDRAAAIWCVSLTFDMSREIMQPKLFDNGEVPPGQHPPFIPQYELVGGCTEKAFNKNEKVLKLKNGSFIGFKAAEQGQLRLQGTEKDLIGFDEAPPKLVYNECVIRRGAGRRLLIRGACTLLPPPGLAGGISWLYIEKIKPWLAGNRPKFLHLQGAKIYDNPHIPKEEIEILEALFPPGSIEREIRLNGAWLPQIMGDLAYGNFRSGIHVNALLGDKRIHPYDAPIPMRRNIPLYLCYDSNVSPMTMVIAQQHGRIYRAYDEIVMRVGTLQDLGREFVRRYPTHRAEAIIYGDATAQYCRSPQSDKSDYDVLMDCFRVLPYPVSPMIPERQPHIRDRINAVNFLFRGINGEVRAEIAPRCPELTEDFETVQRDAHGGILKAKDKKDPYFQRTHTSDGWGYMAVAREPVASAESGAARPNDYGTTSGGFVRMPSPGYAGLGRR